MGIVRIAMLAGREALIQQGDVKEARIHQLESELAMTREELRLIGARVKRIAPHRRPQYTMIERMAILELRAMRGWNKTKTARHFFVSDDTIQAWLGRTDDDSLVQTRTPVNRFPDLVRYVVQQIKLFCPTLGKAKIADKLARAGIHIGKTTVQRILKERPTESPEPTIDDTGKQCRIVSKYPSHTWHADLTAVPISGGFWTNWVPNAIWPRWPICWWILNVVDHYSRRCMGVAVFRSKPSSEEVTTAVTRIMFAERIRPKHLIVDQGPEFKCEHFENIWCKALNILPRFGAVGKHGSSAVCRDILQFCARVLAFWIMQLPRVPGLDDEQTVRQCDFMSLSSSDRRLFVPRRFANTPCPHPRAVEGGTPRLSATSILPVARTSSRSRWSYLR